MRPFHSVKRLGVNLLFTAWSMSLIVCLSTSPFVQEIKASCPTCKAGWVSTRDQIGAGECAHGPEYDDDCGFDDSTDPPTQKVDCGKGNCDCFDCLAGLFISGGECEPDIQDWRAWCGSSDKEKKDDQPNECKISLAPMGVTRQVAESTVMGDGGCNYGDNDGMQQVKWCGVQQNGQDYFSTLGCKSSNCQSTGEWVDQNKGARQKCGN